MVVQILQTLRCLKCLKDTWVFKVSEFSEVCLTEPLRAIQSIPEPSRASFPEHDTSDTSDIWVFEVFEVSEVSEVCPTEPSKAILSSPEIPKAIQSDFSRAWHTSDTSDTWGFEVSEVSEVYEVSWLVHFRYFRHLGV